MGRFKGQNVIVTGGSSGIGRATVLAFAGEGAHVLAVGRNVERLAEVERDAPDGRVETAIADLSLPEEARGVVLQAISRLGRIHVLVNNAGIAFTEPILGISERTWDETLDTNLSGVFWTSQEAARHMTEKGGGAIVNIASTDAIVAESPQAHYNVSKAGVVMLTKSFAHELGHLGVRCNAVAPGQTITAMVAEENRDPDFLRSYLAQIPLQRVAQPEEQAAVILFLASEEASYVNGETIVVDGGQTKGTWYFPDMAPPVPEPGRTEKPKG